MDQLAQIIKDFSEVHVALAPVIFIIGRTFSVVFPPFPGTTLDLVAIPLFGKFMGFIYAEIAMILGGVIDFYIGRYIGRSFIEKFASVEKIEQWEKKIEEKAGFWGLTGVRMATVSIYDYISYIAGLTKMSFNKFFWSSLIASAPPTAAFFYVGGFILDWNAGIVTFIIPIAVAIILLRDKIVTKK